MTRSSPSFHLHKAGMMAGEGKSLHLNASAPLTASTIYWLCLGSEKPAVLPVIPAQSALCATWCDLICIYPRDCQLFSLGQVQLL